MVGGATLVVALLGFFGAVGCSKAPAELVTVGGSVEKVALPGRVTLVVPAGWKGDLAGLVDGSVDSVKVVAVDAKGRSVPVVSADLGGGGASNEQLAEANRAIAVGRLGKAVVPAGSGFGDVFAGARTALETETGPVRVVVLSTGCLEVSGQRLAGADLSSARAVQSAADRFEQSGVLGLPARDGDVLVLAGAGACSSNGVDATARVSLVKRLCSATSMACMAREAEVAR